MRELKVKNVMLFIAFMLMITTFLPIFVNNSRFRIGNYNNYVILWFISVFLFALHTLTNRNFVYVFFYWVILVFFLFNTVWIDIDDWNKRLASLEMLMFLVPISLYTYFLITREYESLAWLMKWTLIFIGITAIMTIYSTTIDPAYARNLTGGLFEETELKAFRKLGGGEYGFAGALLCLFPMIIYYYRNSSKIPFSKLQIFSFGILCFIAVVRMQIFANIILSVIVIIFALSGTKNIRKSLAYVFILVILLAAIPKHIFSNLLFGASTYFRQDSDIYFKLNDLGTFIELGQTVTTSSGGRVDRYPLLWDGFKEDPLLGFFHSGSGMDISSGAHLYWMNKLTVYGILGFIPFVLIFYFYIRRTIRQFDNEFSFYFSLSVFAAIGLGLMKSLMGQEFWAMFFFVLPSLYYLPLLKKKPTTIKK